MFDQILDQTPRGFWNPLGLAPTLWVLLLVVKTIGVTLVLDPVVIAICKCLRVGKMPSREPPIMKGLEALAAKDFSFLVINQVVEAVGVMHFASFAIYNERVQHSLELAGIGNTLGAVYLLFLIDDFIYYWAHRALHLKALYAYVHKHHHRQALPRRGYYDAANEHPLEQVIGLSAVMAALWLVSLSPIGLHAAAIACFFVLYACVALLNHTEYDVQLSWLLLGYSVRAHETHHRFPTTNYAQNTMLWDKLLGTFREYRETKAA